MLVCAQFNTAGRTIKTGLIATDVVSHWCAPLSCCQSVHKLCGCAGRLLSMQLCICMPSWVVAGLGRCRLVRGSTSHMVLLYWQGVARWVTDAWCFDHPRTWAATLLQSSNVTYKYGVSGPFWYAAGATIQIVLFGILAIEVKRKAPTAHTVLEIISAPRAMSRRNLLARTSMHDMGFVAILARRRPRREFGSCETWGPDTACCADARWGKAAHIIFFFFCFATNIIVTSMLILGGASVMNALTGMDIYAVRASARLDKLRSREHSF